MNCPKPSIIIKSHDLHVGDIREAKGEIAFYLDSFLPRQLSTSIETNLLPFFGPFQLCVFWPSFDLPFLSPLGWFWALIFYWIFVFFKVVFLFYLNNFHSQKVKPCCRTTRFSAGLHCQAQKGRWTVLQGGRVIQHLAKHLCLAKTVCKWQTKHMFLSQNYMRLTLSNIGGTSPLFVACAHFIIYKKSLLNPAVRCLQNQLKYTYQGIFHLALHDINNTVFVSPLFRTCSLRNVFGISPFLDMFFKKCIL